MINPTMTSAAPALPTHTDTPKTAGLWPRLRRWLVPAFGVLVLGLLLSNAHKVDWAGAWTALKKYPPETLLMALGFATASHLLYGSFDLIGRHHTRHPLTRLHTWAIAVASYAFNLNLGSLVGGVALRVRLYVRAGLEQSTIAQIVGLSLSTNWLGYCLLAGGLFASGLIAPPDQAHIGSKALRLAGGGMVLVAVAYVVACALCKGREWRVRGKLLHLPSAPVALVQLAISVTNWSLMGAAMFMLLGGKVDYFTTLAVLMAASIVGVLTPIPAGLGVLEAVYVSLLSGKVPQGELLGAVLAYRAVYYLLPMVGGLLLYGLLERHASQHPPTDHGAEAAG